MPRGGGRPRLGFLGVGWIGRTRMETLAATGLAEVVAIAEPDGDLREQALHRAPQAEGHCDLDGLLSVDLDGIVIATPSALHAPSRRSRAFAAGWPSSARSPWDGIGRRPNR